MINWEKLFQLGKNYWKKYWEKINKYWHNPYAFSEFATPSCKWGKVVRLQCKSYKFGPLVWGTTCSLISHVFLFLITSLMVHHKNKSNSLETRLWKDISHQTLQNIRFDRKGRNEISLDKFLIWLPFLISLINQNSGDENNINTWHQEPHLSLTRNQLYGL